MNNLCLCGCGQRTNIWKYNDNRTTRRKGQPMRYIHGHGGRRDGNPCINRVGLKYGKLLVLSYAGKHSFGTQNRKSIAWKCQCECGNVCVVMSSKIRNTKSCGCLKFSTGENASGFKHGHARTVEYRAYHGAKSRCQNPKNNSYSNYGGRGIKFTFTSFNQFLKEVGSRPSPKYSLDRKNVNGDYEIGNVRWALQSIQMKNRRPIFALQNFSDEEIKQEFIRRNLKL